VIILGVIAAIAIPRLSQAVGKSKTAATEESTNRLNRALEMYYVEHDFEYPTDDDIGAQMLGYTDVTGTLQADEADVDQGIVFGPYLDKLPPVPMGPNEGEATMGPEPGKGWIYYRSKGMIVPNLLKALATYRARDLELLDLDADADEEDVIARFKR